MHTHLCLYFISYSSHTFPQFSSGLPNRQHTYGYWAHTKVEEVYYTGITISFQNCQGPLSKVPNITSTLQSIMKVLMTKTLKTGFSFTMNSEDCISTKQALSLK